MKKRWLSFSLIFALFIVLFSPFARADELPYKPGDVDRNGSVTSFDSLLALQHSIQMENLTNDAFDLADVDGDNSVLSVDALLILKNSIKLIDTLPYLKNTVNTDSILNNRAYEQDESADNSFKITTKGLKHKTIYNVNWLSALQIKDQYFYHDAVRLACSLQGLINRDFGITHTSLVFVQITYIEEFWRDYITDKNNFFYGYTIVNINSFDQFYNTFEPQIKQAGLILWDQNVPATSNVAATVCGVDGTIPVRYDTDSGTLYNYLMSRNVPVRNNLVGLFNGSGTIPGTALKSTGSAKNDAYIWALEKYYNRCSNKYIVYAPDGVASCKNSPFNNVNDYAYDAYNSCMPSHDYFIARKAFFFDLCVYDGEAPCDDRNQPVGTDRRTMEKILSARYNRANGEFGQAFGFVPWWLKYTPGSPHRDPNFFMGSKEGVSQEWEFSQLLTNYNMALEADCMGPCYLTNGSVYYKYVTKLPSFENSTSHPSKDLKNYNSQCEYMCMYMGDYDSSAWLVSSGVGCWNDPERGDLPVMWGFNPNLSDRVPMAFEYFYSTKTNNDFFVAGDSGAGYAIPSGLYQGQGGRTNPTAAQKWKDYCQYYYNKFNLNVTGFLLNGQNPLTHNVMELFSQISPKTVFHSVGNQADVHLCKVNNTVFCNLSDVDRISNEIDSNGHTFTYNTAKKMYDYMKNRPYNFSSYRVLLQNVSQIKVLTNQINEYARSVGDNKKYCVVDPENFANLVHQSGQGYNY